MSTPEIKNFLPIDCLQSPNTWTSFSKKESKEDSSTNDVAMNFFSCFSKLDSYADDPFFDGLLQENGMDERFFSTPSPVSEKSESSNAEFPDQIPFPSELSTSIADEFGYPFSDCLLDESGLGESTSVPLFSKPEDDAEEKNKRRIKRVQEYKLREKIKDTEILENSQIIKQKQERGELLTKDEIQILSDEKRVKIRQDRNREKTRERTRNWRLKKREVLEEAQKIAMKQERGYGLTSDEAQVLSEAEKIMQSAKQERERSKNLQLKRKAALEATKPKAPNFTEPVHKRRKPSSSVDLFAIKFPSNASSSSSNSNGASINELLRETLGDRGIEKKILPEEKSFHKKPLNLGTVENLIKKHQNKSQLTKEEEEALENISSNKEMVFEVLKFEKGLSAYERRVKTEEYIARVKQCKEYFGKPSLS